MSPAPARAPNACSSIAPAYRDRTVSGRPAGTRRSAGPGSAPPPAGTLSRASAGSGCAACRLPRLRCLSRLRPAVPAVPARAPGPAAAARWTGSRPAAGRSPRPAPRRPATAGPAPTRPRPVSRGRPARPDQRRRALPQRPLVQRGHVVRRQPRHRGDASLAELQLPEHRHRHVPASPCRPRGTGTAAPTRRKSSSPRRCPGGAGHAARACHPGWRRQRRTQPDTIII